MMYSKEEQQTQQGQQIPQEEQKKPHWKKVLDDPVVKLIFERLGEI
jgi:hypothetical protein